MAATARGGFEAVLMRVASRQREDLSALIADGAAPERVRAVAVDGLARTSGFDCSA